MAAKQFYFGALLVDDNTDIIEQHVTLLGNLQFVKQTPGILYKMLKSASLSAPSEKADRILQEGKWPTKQDLSDTLQINPHRSDSKYSVVDISTANNASEADSKWQEQKKLYQGLSQDSFGCYVALLDHDMPGQNGLQLSQQWRPFADGTRLKRFTEDSPLIIFYTGKAAMLEEALKAEGYSPDLGGVSNTGLAEEVIQKGIDNDDFNKIMWSLLEQRVQEIATKIKK